MKKFLIILMVVAMASFLFVGCLGVTPDIEDDDEEEPVLPASITPVIEKIANVGDDKDKAGIISLYSSVTQYMNAEEITDGILVKGYAPKYSEVNIYINDKIVGTSIAYGTLEYFIVFVAEDNLGDDEAKTIYATATELGFAESDPSTTYEFTLDTAKPYIVNVTAEIDKVDITLLTVTATFSEELAKATAEDAEDWNVNVAVGDITVELISSKVVEIGVSKGVAEFSVGDVIRIAYEDIGNTFIKDLAGNPAVDSIEYCYAELEE